MFIFSLFYGIHNVLFLSFFVKSRCFLSCFVRVDDIHFSKFVYFVTHSYFFHKKERSLILTISFTVHRTRGLESLIFVFSCICSDGQNSGIRDEIAYC